MIHTIWNQLVSLNGTKIEFFLVSLNTGLTLILVAVVGLRRGSRGMGSGEGQGCLLFSFLVYQTG